MLCFPVFVVVLAWRLREADRRSWLPWLVLVMGSLSACVKLASAAPMFALAWRAGSSGVSDGVRVEQGDRRSPLISTSSTGPSSSGRSVPRSRRSRAI